MSDDNHGVQPIIWRDQTLHLLDQRRLPREVVWVECRHAAAVFEAIRSMIVRGAPAIGLCAAFGLAMEASATPEGPVDALAQRLRAAATHLRMSRPTAINLGWAIDRMLARLVVLTGEPQASSQSTARSLVAEAEAIFREDVEANRRLGAFGAQLLGERSTILTHCNAGALATAGYGTALGVVRAARDAGKRIAVFADETRPYLQGARLTAWELQQDGIDVTLITDNMAGHFFQLGTFDAAIVGADRIAANGDTANKIGTYTVAVLAHAHGVPFYVAAPVSTIDIRCATGAEIPIEERAGDEVVEALGWDREGQPHRVRIAPEGIAVRHPAFDVTPAGLISAIITDRGVLRPPFGEAIKDALGRGR
ncbi:MAG TPA: S-methyl-5-thioribose-1-phosphate isomerase [Thermoanaerobaculia bacterium]|nr:S-methyl-5-thioribose-1-phosphate isomerase [Thermoanaerobaculia bacterium]